MGEEHPREVIVQDLFLFLVFPEMHRVQQLIPDLSLVADRREIERRVDMVDRSLLFQFFDFFAIFQLKFRRYFPVIVPKRQNAETFTQRLRQRLPEDTLEVTLEKGAVHDLLEYRGNVSQVGDQRLLFTAFYVKLAPNFTQFILAHRDRLLNRQEFKYALNYKSYF